MTKPGLLIVGAAGSIGQAIVQRAHADYTVHALSRRSVPDHPSALTHIGDAVAGSLPEITDALAGLVYCPGTITLKPFTGLKVEDFLLDFQVNLLGAVRCLQRYAKNLQASDGGSVVLMSSVAVQTGFKFHASIAAAKGAVEGLTRALAAEWAPKIRVNAIAPSLTDTPLAARLLADDKRKHQAAQRHPLDRIGHADDIAEMALFLLSSRSSWITGQIMHVDGGMSSIRD